MPWVPSHSGARSSRRRKAEAEAQEKAREERAAYLRNKENSGTELSSAEYHELHPYGWRRP